MSTDQDAQLDSLIQTMEREGMKVKRMYDGSSRVTSQYEAPRSAANGDLAILTTYTYVGATSNVDAMKETLSAWNSAWDI